MRPTAPMFPRSTRRSSILSQPSGRSSQHRIKNATVVLRPIRRRRTRFPMSGIGALRWRTTTHHCRRRAPLGGFASRPRGDTPRCRQCPRNGAPMTVADTTALADRLRDLRDDALRQLGEALPVVDTGLLALVAHISTALAALDEEGRP